MAGKKRRPPVEGTGAGGGAVLKTKKPQFSKKFNETPNATLDAARNAVLDTTELLEAIITCLPIKKIFMIQRVSRRFRGVIRKSVQIQQKQFIRPCAKEDIWELVHLPLYPGQPDHELNPKVKFVTGHPAETTTEKARVLFVPAVLRPILDAEPAPVPAYERLWFNNGDSRWIHLTTLIERPGSWEHMQLTDPPCKRMRFSVILELYDSWGNTIARDQEPILVERAGGIVLGDILPAMIAAQTTFCSATTRHGSKHTIQTGILQNTPELFDAVTGKRHARSMRIRISAEFESMVLPNAEEPGVVPREALRKGPGEQEEQISSA